MEEAGEVEAYSSHAPQKSPAFSFTQKTDSFLPASRFSEFLLQLADKHFPLLTACHWFPYTPLLQEREARTDIPFAFTPFALVRAKKEGRERKTTTQHTHAGDVRQPA